MLGGNDAPQPLMTCRSSASSATDESTILRLLPLRSSTIAGLEPQFPSLHFQNCPIYLVILSSWPDWHQRANVWLEATSPRMRAKRLNLRAVRFPRSGSLNTAPPPPVLG